MGNPATSSSLPSDPIPRDASGPKCVALRVLHGKDINPSPRTAPDPSVSPTVVSPDGLAALSGDSTVGVGMGDLKAASRLPLADHTDGDVLMEPPMPPSDGFASPSRKGSRPTLADVLGQQEHLRRDHDVATAARHRVKTLQPLARYIEWIKHHYAAGGD